MTSESSTDAAPRAKRLTAEARRESILVAARRAFSRTGDMNGTTTKAIAAEAGISEGIIYRHFESKEHLFLEAVVEPLSHAVDELVEAIETIDRDEAIDPDRRLDRMRLLYQQLVTTLEEMLPLLGLVLFGDPGEASRFYRDNLAAAMDRLAAAWQAAASRNEVRLDTPEVSARAVMGMALMLALESRHTGDFDRRRAIQLVSEGTLDGFFPRGA